MVQNQHGNIIGSYKRVIHSLAADAQSADIYMKIGWILNQKNAISSQVLYVESLAALCR